MCRFESHPFCCPGGGCDIQTSLRPPGSAARQAEMPPWSETHALWEGVSGWDGKQKRRSAHRGRQAESACAGRGLIGQRTQASSVTMAAVRASANRDGHTL